MRTDQVNVVLVIALISWIMAQVIKTALNAAKFKKFDKERVLGSGGMPSSHSATVCSLVIAISRVADGGVLSCEFALAMVLALVVMYDATGVRRSAGLQAKEINRLKKIVDELDEELLEDIDEKIDLGDDDEESKELKEMLGHTPFEVLCGALLGIIIGMAFPIVVV